jgi:hypothetical protein
MKNIIRIFVCLLLFALVLLMSQIRSGETASPLTEAPAGLRQSDERVHHSGSV